MPPMTRAMSTAPSRHPRRGRLGAVIAGIGLALLVPALALAHPLGNFTINHYAGIRVEPDTETAGLDVSEHGMWGYPEFYIPVPGGYGTETHGHLGLSHGNGHGHTSPAPVVPAATPEPAPG